MQITRNLKHIFFCFLIAFFVIIGVLRFFGASFFLPITHFFVYQEGNVLLDTLYKYNFTPSKDIIIIKIDDESINSLQAGTNMKLLALSKSVYADVVNKLLFAKVKGLGLDIVFQNADPNEKEFADLLAKNNNIVIARTKDVGNCIDDTEGIYQTCEGAPRSVYDSVRQGLIDLGHEGDRLYVNQSGSGGKSFDTLSLALFKSNNTVETSFEENSYTLIPFFGIPGIYHSMNLKTFLGLSDRDLVNNFSGKYVFIGESGTLIHDAIKSPVTESSMDGVETHAHFLDGILQKRFLKRWSIDNPIFVLSILSFMILMVSLYLFAPKVISIVLAILSTFSMMWLARFLYATNAIVIDMGMFLMAGSIISFPVTYIYRYFILDREKRMLTSAFSHYVDGRVVEKIAASRKPINLGGESRRLSILFSDIAGFTTLSEEMSPERLFFLMSSYLSRMTDILTKNGGTLDKYIGDAVMGFYGAPLENIHHAKDACETALKMRAALPDFNKELIAKGMEPIDFRVGIATGEVVVGNIGSYERFNYTVLGDTVNLASRLEGTSKEYGTHILVPEATYEDTKDFFHYRKLDKIAVKGKNEGIFIYELIAKKDEGSDSLPLDLSRYQIYETALEKYFLEDYIEAGKLFESNESVDPPSGVLKMRCFDILRGKIQIKGGIYRMEHK